MASINFPIIYFTGCSTILAFFPYSNQKNISSDWLKEEPSNCFCADLNQQKFLRHTHCFSFECLRVYKLNAKIIYACQLHLVKTFVIYVVRTSDILQSQKTHFQWYANNVDQTYNIFLQNSLTTLLKIINRLIYGQSIGN